MGDHMIAEPQEQFDSRGVVQLRRIADDMRRYARTLSQISMPDGAIDLPTETLADGEPQSLPTPKDLRKLLRVRRMRDNHFRTELFADPAWDILLDLLAAHQEGEEISISSLCIASAVPPTTALRWIHNMTEEGLLERRSDPLDGRRIFIELAPETVEAMTHYFASIQRFACHPI
jgi:DNA-binding MarR family transcriptional regulator